MPAHVWNEQIHDAKLKEFLTHAARRQLFFYIDPQPNVNGEYKLVAQNEIPSTQVDELFYLIKSHYSQEITNKETFHKCVQYGAFNGKHLLSLLRLCSGLYAPLFFGNKTWPDSKKLF